ncbi:MAG: replication-relaxation family protein [Bdellovibrionales bacterium]|nr:replication-relaxation family protein [Bdellovibrionales bacterium]
MSGNINEDRERTPPDSQESGGKRKRYKCERVIPTARDLALLSDLYHFVVLSLRQIKHRHFDGVSKCTMLNRLKRLEEGGLVRRYRVTNFRDTVGTHDVGTVFQITRSGISALQAMHSNQYFRPMPSSIGFQSLQHDLTVNEVQWALVKRFPQIAFTNGRLVESDDNAMNQPDIVGDIEGTKVAVEAELTVKSEKRYRELLLNYQVVRRFESVVYVTGNDSIKRKVQEAVLGYRRSAENSRDNLDTGSIYFVDLKALLTKRPDALITNGVQEFNLITKRNL